MNSHYYCYDKYYRDTRPEQLGNECVMVTINNKAPPFPEELWINIPKGCENNDIIAIQTNSHNGQPSFSYSGLNTSLL